MFHQGVCAFTFSQYVAPGRSGQLVSSPPWSSPRPHSGYPRRNGVVRRSRRSAALVQLPGASGCLVDRSAPRAGCKSVRALRGPAPFLGSEAIAISPDGKNVYVASSRSNAIAVFKRNARTGELTQRAGVAGCIAAQGAGGCATGIGLEGPNSVAVSPDGRNVYATSLDSNAIDVFARNPSTGALTQASAGTGGGCIANVATSGCATGRALDGPDVVVVSPDGRNVYVGAFKGSAIAVFTRDPSTGALAQPSGTSGCIADTPPIAGCAPASRWPLRRASRSAPTATTSTSRPRSASALDVFTRNSSTGALTQASGGAGCIVAGRARRLHDRHAARRRGRRGGQPRRHATST